MTEEINIIEIPNKRIKDLTGQEFGNLVVKGYIGKNTKNSALWLCRCKCDNYTTVTTTDLKNGHVKSCGCLRSEICIERNKKGLSTIHDMSRTRIYRIWQAMKNRCDNENSDRYKDYGGRGISYCNRWNNFTNFYKDMKDTYKNNLTIDRINVDGNYEKDNCRWITNKEQQNNKRYHHLLSHNGKIQNIAKWSEETGLPYDVIWSRIQKGWKDDDILKPLTEDKLNQNDIENIIELHNNSYSTRKIGKLYNVSHTTIIRVIKENNNEQNIKDSRISQSM